MLFICSSISEIHCLSVCMFVCAMLISSGTLVQPEINIYSSKMEMSFSSSDLEKCSIASLAQQWMLCSEWVPSEWESKQLINTSQIIHTKWCTKESDGMLYFFKSDEERNSSTSQMAWVWGDFPHIFILGWTSALQTSWNGFKAHF